MAINLITEACSNGARTTKACELAGISLRTLQRWHNDQRSNRKTPPSNKLTEEEKAQILEICDQAEYRRLPPQQIVPILADEGIYIASETINEALLKPAPCYFEKINNR